MFCWHLWGKWKDYRRVDRYDVLYGVRLPNQAPYASYLTQTKECQKCGKKKVRKLRI